MFEDILGWGREVSIPLGGERVWSKIVAETVCSKR